MDGLDCGLFTLHLTEEYHLIWELLDFKTYPYSLKIKKEIYKCFKGNAQQIQSTHILLGKEFSNLAHRFLCGRKVDIIASHGQTVAHIDGKSTLQIGDVTLLKDLGECPVIYDFRQKDIDAGGNGAPLTPFLDYLLFRNSNQSIITLNLGGIANISFIPEKGTLEEVVGFDTGPGMALIDELCISTWNTPIDKNGIHAKKGKVDKELLHFLMKHPFINRKPPKSTGRDVFGSEFVAGILNKFQNLSPEDILRTFCLFTAKSIAENLDNHLNFSSSKTTLYMSGGGVHHPILIDELRKNIPVKEILLSESAGISPDVKESLLMAVLGLCKVLGIPSNIKSVTGAKKSVVLGKCS